MIRAHCVGRPQTTLQNRGLFGRGRAIFDVTYPCSRHAYKACAYRQDRWHYSRERSSVCPKWIKSYTWTCPRWQLLFQRVALAVSHIIQFPVDGRVVDTSMEAFIMRLYRQSNSVCTVSWHARPHPILECFRSKRCPLYPQEGFIKAFSDHVDAFLKGFAHAQRLMRNLYVSRLMIYPR